MPDKIKIAVSSCLLGEAVRYDGTDKYIKSISELMSEYNLISLCPEMAVGMGVPRPAIHLVDTGTDIQVKSIVDGNNMTKPLAEYAISVLEEHKDLCGYIFKKNSPSCGTKDVKVLNIEGQYDRRGIGIYANEIIKTLPLIPVIDETNFLDESLRNEFLNKVNKYSKRY